MPNQKRSTIWVDAAGMTYQTIILTDTGGAAIEADLLAVSNAARQDMWEGQPGGAIGTPTAATYESVGDYAVLYYVCVDSTVVSLRLPAPVAAIFKTDGQTVDSTNADIVTLNGSVIGHLLSASGSPASAYVGGLRKRQNRDYA